MGLFPAQIEDTGQFLRGYVLRLFTVFAESFQTTPHCDIDPLLICPTNIRKRLPLLTNTPSEIKV